MNVHPPDMDGYDVTRRLMADGTLKHIPAITVTANVLSSDDIKAYCAGCKGYLTKSFHARDLLAAVQSYQV